MMDQKTYIPESTEAELTRINEDMDIANAHLVQIYFSDFRLFLFKFSCSLLFSCSLFLQLMFPIIMNDHWILICLDYILKQVQFLNHVIRTSETVLPHNTMKYVADNLVLLSFLCHLLICLSFLNCLTSIFSPRYSIPRELVKLLKFVIGIFRIIILSYQDAQNTATHCFKSKLLSFYFLQTII